MKLFVYKKMKQFSKKKKKKKKEKEKKKEKNSGWLIRAPTSVGYSFSHRKIGRVHVFVWRVLPICSFLTRSEICSRDTPKHTYIHMETYYTYVHTRANVFNEMFCCLILKIKRLIYFSVDHFYFSSLRWVQRIIQLFNYLFELNLMNFLCYFYFQMSWKLAMKIKNMSAMLATLIVYLIRMSVAAVATGQLK